MKKIEEICEEYALALCYIFGSQKEAGKTLLKGNNVEVEDPESDIDFAVLFASPPENPLEIYALLSLDIQDLFSPFKADLLFLHEVDHLIQLEVIKGINVFSVNEQVRESYEEKVMTFASDELEIFKCNERDLLEAIKDGYFEFEYKANRRQNRVYK